MKDIVKVKCYNQVKEWERQEAIAFFYEGMTCCGGSEQERYMNIYYQLIEGKDYCVDMEI